jgi:hypothetical protein
MKGMPQMTTSACPFTGTAYCSKTLLEDLLVHGLGLAGVHAR